MRSMRISARGAAAVALIAITTAAVAVAMCPTAATATSLYAAGAAQSGFSGMYCDYKARQVGDLLTIMVTEVSYAQNRTDTQTQKGIGANLSPDGAVFDFLKAVKLDAGAGLNLGNSSKGGTTTSRSGKLIGTITAQVVEVLPNGDLRIRGVREVSVNREKEQMIVTGIVRQRDISPGNTIPSTMVADAQIAFSGDIYTGEKGGIFKTLWDGLVYLWNWIF
jgi:flagellar L-ring protein precursor FlgH